MYRMISEDQIGGGWVRRPDFRTGGDVLKNGTHLTREWLLKMPCATRVAAVNTGFIELYPVGLVSERFVLARGEGVYDVVEGRRLNEQPLSRKEAQALVVSAQN